MPPCVRCFALALVVLGKTSYTIFSLRDNPTNCNICFTCVFHTKVGNKEIYKSYNHTSWYFTLHNQSYAWHRVGYLYDLFSRIYRDADKSLARPERKEATETEGFEFHISYL